MRRLAVTAFLLLAGAFAVPATAQQAPGPTQAAVVLVTSKPALGAVEDGKSKVALSFLNTTTAEVAGLTVAPDASAGGCDLSIGPAVLLAERQTTVTVTVEGCADDKAVAFAVKAGTQTFKLNAARATPSPDWSLLATPFLIAIGVTALLVLVLVAKRTLSHVVDVGEKYDFKSSWASNLTVAAAAFTGVVGGTETAKILLGADASAYVAVMTVGAALALALAAVAALLVASFIDDKYLKVWVLLLAGFFTLVAVGGQLATVVAVGVAASDLDPWIWSGGIAGGALLALYGVRTLWAATGTSKPKVAGAPPGAPPEKVTALI